MYCLQFFKWQPYGAQFARYIYHPKSLNCETIIRRHVIILCQLLGTDVIQLKIEPVMLINNVISLVLEYVSSTPLVTWRCPKEFTETWAMKRPYLITRKCGVIEMRSLDLGLKFVGLGRVIKVSSLVAFNCRRITVELESLSSCQGFNMGPNRE